VLMPLLEGGKISTESEWPVVVVVVVAVAVAAPEYKPTHQPRLLLLVDPPTPQPLLLQQQLLLLLLTFMLLHIPMVVHLPLFQLHQITIDT